jgi:hypothetical protein
MRIQFESLALFLVASTFVSDFDALRAEPHLARLDDDPSSHIVRRKSTQHFAKFVKMQHLFIFVGE